MQTLFLTVMVAAVADLLLPPSGLKKTARWALGVAILGVLLRPLAGSFPFPPAAFFPATDLVSPASTSGLAGAGSDSIRDAFRTLLESKMADGLRSWPEVQGAKVEVFLREGPYPWGDVAAVKVQVEAGGEAAAGMDEKVRQWLATTWEIPAAKVQVEVVQPYGP
ncbi:MAG: stage III sporulation protein AF [Bacillota bacterium]|nr:stage III sporulation protein AF [Bacillota bacterium]